MSTALRIERVPIGHPDAQLLVEAVQEVYVGLYGSRDETPIEPGYFEPPQGSFFVGYLGGRPVASGAWRFRPDLANEVRPTPAEIKRMFVVPEFQRSGRARAMLAHLEQTAAAAGATDVVLETGAPQVAAIALYTASGYVPIPGFGHYRRSPVNRCLARRL